MTERRRGGSALDDLLDDLLASYARGVIEAVRSEDPAAMVRARVEVQAAEVELSRFNNNALPPVDRRAVADTREALMRLLAPLEPGPTPPPSAPPPGATDAPPAPTQAPPAPEATATSTASVTATVRPLPTATATATSTYTATATQSPPLEPRRP
ncbi:MAG: hypothetical protein ACE5EL_06985, partial [Anaerolineae bacterium]